MGDLTKSFEAEYLKYKLIEKCGFHRPIKLKKCDDFEKLEAEGYHNLACQYPRKDEVFGHFGVNHPVFDRFVELLAPLTLYEFSKASKAVYYHCLRIRGLEYKDIIYGQEETTFDAVDGRRRGGQFSDDWVTFQRCHGSLEISSIDFTCNRQLVDFGQHYKILKLHFSNRLFDMLVNLMCEMAYYPGVEHAYLDIYLMRSRETISIQKVAEMLDFFKDVKSLWFHLDYVRPSRMPLFKDNCNFVSLKKVIENWAAQTTRMEFFVLTYQNHTFQLHNNKLKRVVMIQSKFCMYEEFEIDEGYHQPCAVDVFDRFESENPKFYLKYSFDEIDQVVGSFLKKNAAKRTSVFDAL